METSSSDFQIKAVQAPGPALPPRAPRQQDWTPAQAKDQSLLLEESMQRVHITAPKVMQSAFLTAAHRPAEASGKPPAGPSKVQHKPFHALLTVTRPAGSHFQPKRHAHLMSAHTPRQAWALAGKRAVTAAVSAAGTGAPQPVESGPHQLPAHTAHQARCSGPQARRHPHAAGGLRGS